MITLLSFGGGQDSTAILLKCLFDKQFNEKYVKGELVVVMSDTGDEHYHTYSHVGQVEVLCDIHNVFFKLIKTADGFHSPAWPNLIDPQVRPEGGQFKPTMVQLKTKSCTTHLKIDPIYKFVDEYLNQKYGSNLPMGKGRGCGKRAIKRYKKLYGDLNVLIGYAYGEEKRSEAAKRQELKDKQTKSWRSCIQRVFPLIEEKLDRNACQEINKKTFLHDVFPSNCIRCPYMSDVELIWLYRFHRQKFDEWVEIEQAKLKRFEGTDKNHGVFNTKTTITERLEKALKKHSSITGERLWEYKFNHGCTVNGV